MQTFYQLTESDYRDKVYATLEAWVNLASYTSSLSDDGDDYGLTEDLYRNTLLLVLRREWAKVLQPLKTRLSITLQKIASNLANTCASNRCHHMIYLVKTPWTDATLSNIIYGNPVTDAEALKFCLTEMPLALTIRLELLCDQKWEDLALKLVAFCRKCLTNPSNFQVLEACSKSQQELWLDLHVALLYRQEKRRTEILPLLEQYSLEEGHKVVKRLIHRHIFKSLSQNGINGIWRNSLKIAEFCTTCLLKTALMQCPPPSSLKSLAIQLVKFQKSTKAVSDVFIKMVDGNKRVTSSNLYILCETFSEEFGDDLKSLCIELYVRAVAVDLNDFENRKLNGDGEEIKLAEISLATKFSNLAELVHENVRICKEVALTAFSLHPSKERFDKLVELAALPLEQATNTKPTFSCTMSGDDVASGSGQVGCSSSTCAKETLEDADSGVDMIDTTNKVGEQEVESPNTSSQDEETPNPNSDAVTLGVSEAVIQNLAKVVSSCRWNALTWTKGWAVLEPICHTMCYMADKEQMRSATKELHFLNTDCSQDRLMPERDEIRYEECTEPLPNAIVERSRSRVEVEPERKRQKSKESSRPASDNSSHHLLEQSGHKKVLKKKSIFPKVVSLKNASDSDCSPPSLTLIKTETESQLEGVQISDIRKANKSHRISSPVLANMLRSYRQDTSFSSIKHNLWSTVPTTQSLLCDTTADLSNNDQQHIQLPSYSSSSPCPSANHFAPMLSTLDMSPIVLLTRLPAQLVTQMVQLPNSPINSRLVASNKMPASKEGNNGSNNGNAINDHRRKSQQPQGETIKATTSPTDTLSYTTGSEDVPAFNISNSVEITHVPSGDASGSVKNDSNQDPVTPVSTPTALRPAYNSGAAVLQPVTAATEFNTPNARAKNPATSSIATRLRSSRSTATANRPCLDELPSLPISQLLAQSSSIDSTEASSPKSQPGAASEASSEAASDRPNKSARTTSVATNETVQSTPIELRSRGEPSILFRPSPLVSYEMDSQSESEGGSCVEQFRELESVFERVAHSSYLQNQLDPWAEVAHPDVESYIGEGPVEFLLPSSTFSESMDVSESSLTSPNSTDEPLSSQPDESGSVANAPEVGMGVQLMQFPTVASTTRQALEERENSVQSPVASAEIEVEPVEEDVIDDDTEDKMDEAMDAFITQLVPGQLASPTKVVVLPAVLTAPIVVSDSETGQRSVILSTSSSATSPLVSTADKPSPKSHNKTGQEFSSENNPDASRNSSPSKATSSVSATTLSETPQKADGDESMGLRVQQILEDFKEKIVSNLPYLENKPTPQRRSTPRALNIMLPASSNMDNANATPVVETNKIEPNSSAVVVKAESESKKTDSGQPDGVQLSFPVSAVATSRTGVLPVAIDGTPTMAIPSGVAVTVASTPDTLASLAGVSTNPVSMLHQQVLVKAETGGVQSLLFPSLFSSARYIKAPQVTMSVQPDVFRRFPAPTVNVKIESQQTQPPLEQVEFVSTGEGPAILKSDIPATAQKCTSCNTVVNKRRKRTRSEPTSSCNSSMEHSLAKKANTGSNCSDVAPCSKIS